ncbi:MAG: hypothetical protein U5K81_01375 [Trueperaceae bacterium]|nr:hypothetical protein [Trueperaceae bacterium]
MLGRLLNEDFKYVAIAPLILALLVLTLYPAFQLVRMAFAEVELVSGGTIFSYVGLENLRTLLDDRVARIALTNTVLFTVVVVPIEAFLGLALAYLVSQVRALSGFYRTVLIVPLLLPPSPSARCGA